VKGGWKGRVEMPEKGEGREGKEKGKEGERGRGKKNKNTPSVNFCLRPWQP